MVLLRTLLLPLLWSQSSCHARPNFFLNPSSILTKKTSSNFNIKAIYYEAHVFAPKQPKPFFDQGSVPAIYDEAPVFAPKQPKPSFDQGSVPSIYGRYISLVKRWLGLFRGKDRSFIINGMDSSSVKRWFGLLRGKDRSFKINGRY